MLDEHRSIGPVQALLLACAFFVSSCSTLVAPSHDALTPPERSISGRISVQYKDLSTGRAESLSGRFEWVQNGGEIEVSLLDPLGQTVALLITGSRNNSGNNSDPKTSSLRLRDGRTFTGDAAEDLTEEVLGWRLPVRGLGYWLDGEPSPESAAERDSNDGGANHGANGGTNHGTNGGNSATQFVQDGWTIRYPAAANDELPRRIDLAYPGPIAEVKLRLVIDSRTPAGRMRAPSSSGQGDPDGAP